MTKKTRKQLTRLREKLAPYVEKYAGENGACGFGRHDLWISHADTRAMLQVLEDMSELADEVTA